MNALLLATIATGALVGAGLAVTLAGLTRWHPVLSDALAILDERLPRPAAEASAAPGTRTAVLRVLVDVARRLPGSVGERDLEVLQLDRDRHLVGRLGTALAYAAIGPALAVVLLVLDAGLPVVVPTGFCVVGAVVGWTSYGRRTRDRADDVREELRYVLVAYLQQVSLLRRGGAGIATALGLPPQLLDDSEPMRRIGRELELAERAGLMPWEGLRRFGTQIDVSELEDLSTIAETAGHDGGAVIDTLLARAESLNDELIADAHTAANRATGQMSTPGAIQVFLIAAWVLFPAAATLLSS